MPRSPVRIPIRDHRSDPQHIHNLNLTWNLKHVHNGNDQAETHLPNPMFITLAIHLPSPSSHKSAINPIQSAFFEITNFPSSIPIFPS